MADISMEETSYNECKSLITSTPYKSVNDSGYNTPSSTLSIASSNLSKISEVSITFDHTPSEISSLQLPSNIYNFTIDRSVRKLEDITNATNSNVIFSTPPTYQELSPSKKLKLCTDLQMRFRVNSYPKNDENQFLRRKNSTTHKSINHERISLEDREKVDIMYFLAERHHFEPVIEKIFSYLLGSDILSMSMVSKIWCNAVKNSTTAQKKIKLYFKLSKENRNGYDGRDRSLFHNKGCLANIGNVMRSPSKRDIPPRSPPVSPSKYRFHVFQKVIKIISVKLIK